VLVREWWWRGTGRDVQLGEDVLQMSAHRVFADDQLLGDLAVGSPSGDQHKHLDLTTGQTAGGITRRSRKQCVEP
jgi:hypothetical protein